ncbi:Crp/Fnr family transcriptional regulator [Elizabethkingia anophelis]|uniref:Crp/Fnr family transcriptional regulator n=1 Tax=Elizabethkingia anophelis TaxID=1117645 RepID=UPI000C6CDB50|nr:Crp/Fnr family transcriptional regulator [Elizabethkingia anophelis]MDV3752531.1 Crp/Fnr family transcriptional regulator [Elizabethkingia anophelis]MDV3756029.1 Crp/Fnr family transcriptional regulator [Elizabethkingia anophelis]PKR31842.1 Crp/Fnr family transcriptional regulator [Elizabethkingia anophelis]PKR35634.1 Crp/Fnr family transcriptional regulator [Elizabethkingia anophelis]PRQ78705.1 Crp/Fnr family transcriptional regulator [Elizabethkingia anophelis]
MSSRTDINSLLKDENLFEKAIILNRNEYLKEAGSIDTNIYFIREGSVRIFISDNAEERNIRFGYSGNIIVSLDSFLSNKPSPLYIQSLKKTTILIASKDSFMQIMNKDPQHLQLWNSILEDLNLQQFEREIDLLTQSPRERYHRLLKRSPQVFQQIPNKHIANYLRMTPETLSRIKKS